MRKGLLCLAALGSWGLLLSLQNVEAGGSGAAKKACQTSVSRSAVVECSRLQFPAPTDKSIYVIDTNALYRDPDLLTNMGDKNLVLARSVIKRELDHHKKELSERGLTARHVSARLKQLIKQLTEARNIPLDEGGFLNITEVSKHFDWPDELNPTDVDDRIIGLAMELRENHKGRKVVILTGDTNVEILARSFGLEVQEPAAEVDPKLMKQLINGPIVLTISDEDFDLVSSGKGLEMPDLVELGLSSDVQLYPNQFVVIRSEGRNFNLEQSMKTVFRYVHNSGQAPRLQRMNSMIANLPIVPRDKEQVMAMDLLLDPNVDLVTLAGGAGTGKTLLTMLSGLIQSDLWRMEEFGNQPGLKGRPRFSKIVLTRPNQVVGKDIGFLPGSIEEKMYAFMGPFRDNISVILESIRKKKDGEAPWALENGVKDREKKAKTNKEIVEKIMKSDFVDIASVAYSRGRSWDDTLIVVDEAQNLTKLEVLMLITRAGEGAKVVLLGDLDQIDNNHLNHTNNGLAITANEFRGTPEYPATGVAGHVTLVEGQRSRLSREAAIRLGNSRRRSGPQ